MLLVLQTSWPIFSAFPCMNKPPFINPSIRTYLYFQSVQSCTKKCACLVLMQRCNCRWESATLFSLIFGGICYFGRYVLPKSFYPTKDWGFPLGNLLRVLILMARCKICIWLMLYSLIGVPTAKNTLKIPIIFSRLFFARSFLVKRFWILEVNAHILFLFFLMVLIWQ